MPKGLRLKPEQAVAKLREIEVKLSQGKDVLTVCREAGVADKRGAPENSDSGISEALQQWAIESPRSREYETTPP